MSSENPDTVESSRWIFVGGLFLAPTENGGAGVALMEKEPLRSTVNVDPDCQDSAGASEAESSPLDRGFMETGWSDMRAARKDLAAGNLLRKKPNADASVAELTELK